MNGDSNCSLKSGTNQKYGTARKYSGTYCQLKILQLIGALVLSHTPSCDISLVDKYITTAVTCNFVNWMFLRML